MRNKSIKSPKPQSKIGSYLAFRANFESRSPLDEIVREGARRMLQAAIDAEVDDFLADHSTRRDEQGRRQVVRKSVWGHHRRRCIICVLVFLALGFHTVILRSLGSLLVTTEVINDDDDVLLLSGDRRFDFAKELYELNPERRIMLMRASSNRLVDIGVSESSEEIFHRELSVRQIPMVNQIVLSSDSPKGASRIESLRAWFSKHSNASIALVCDEMGSAKVQHHLRKSLPEFSHRLKVCALKDRRFGVDDWWMSRTGIRTVVLNYVSLIISKSRSKPPISFKSTWSPDQFEATLKERRGNLNTQLNNEGILPGLAEWLDVGSEPEAIDFVLTLPGDENVRPFVGAALVKAGFARKALVLKNPPSPAVEDGIELETSKTIRRVLSHQGVNANQIQDLTGLSNSTYEDAVLTKRFFDDRPESRIAIVTSHYHTRRARMVFRYVFGERANDFVFVSAPTDEFTKQNWWQTETGTNMILAEYVKLGIYWIQYSNGKYWIFFVVVGFSGLYWRRRRSRIRKNSKAADQDGANSSSGLKEASPTTTVA